jgi:uncharacterized membrane protein YfhO
MLDDAYYITRPNFIEGTNSPGNAFNIVWFNEVLKKQDKKVNAENATAVNQKTTKYSFNLSEASESQLTINTAFFPGWKVFIDTKEQILLPDKNGLISFLFPKGEHHVDIRFTDTPIRKIAGVVSLLTLLLLTVLLLRFSSIIRE